MEALEKIRVYLQEQHLDGLILMRRDNYAWVSGGAKNHVMTNTETGVACLLITPQSLTLLADSSDAPRMEKEQNPLKAEVVLIPWYESMEAAIQKRIDGANFVSDTGVAGTRNIQDALIRLRMDLSEKEVDLYRELGQSCAQIVENICRTIQPGQTEREAAALLSFECLKQGISPDCVLAGADERILAYRHPVPTDKEIQNRFMLVLGGEKYGLNISLTRMVSFEPLSEEIRERYGKTAYIFANMQTMMKEGLSYKEYFRQVQTLYAEAGYEEEWQQHHQGGPTGYGCREIVVSPKMEGTFHVGQAFAWNPTIQGTKCEETTYLSETGIQNWTQTENWPRMAVQTPNGIFAVADILERS